jgi:hypothetical protein
MKLKASHRAAVFWLGCIPTRSILILIAKRHNPLALRAFASVVGYRWVTGLEEGGQTYFGGPAWWAGERGLHGVLWLAYAITGDWRWLAADTAFGAANWLTTSY